MLQESVEALSKNFDDPILVRKGSVPVFRHKQQNDLLQSWLKCVRSVSTLNACYLLLSEGYFQEVGSLFRSLDEFFQDVLFLAAPLGDNGYSDDQRRLVEEFFQEEFEDLDNPFDSSRQRNRLPRRKVLAGIANIKGNPINPSDSQRLNTNIYRAYSGYVHGAYVHIMEMFGGKAGELKVHMSGIASEFRRQEFHKDLVTYIFRVGLAIEIVAKRCGDSDVVEQVETVLKELRETASAEDGNPQRLLDQIKLKRRRDL